MSIIQNLRDRAAWIISGAIAFALLIFVVEEGLRNKSVFGGDTNVLGKVDGRAIDRQNFETKLKKLEDRYAQMGYTMDDISRNQQRNSLWNEEVEALILEEKIGGLGLDVTDKEVGDILYGNNPPQDNHSGSGSFLNTRLFHQAGSSRRELCAMLLPVG